LDPAPKAAFAEARALLRELGAIDADGRITDEGRQLARLPLPPRLARMVVDGAAAGGGQLAAEIAAVVSERGLGGDDVDLTPRFDAWRRDRSQRAQEARQMSRRWAAAVPFPAREPEGLSPGLLLALAYPDRIARNRASGSGAFLLANGRGAAVDPASGLAREPFLAVAELAGTAGQGRVVLAAPIAISEIETLFPDRIEAREEVVF